MGKAFQAKESASVKALRWVGTCFELSRTGRSPGRLEQREQGLLGGI